MVLALALGIATAHAASPDLPTIAARDGLSAVAEAVVSLKSATKNAKKFDQAAADAGLGKIAIPVSAVFGAELSLTSFQPMTNCGFEGDDLHCRFTAETAAQVQAGEYSATCRSKYGATRALPVTLVESTASSATFQASDVLACWEHGVVKVTVQPTSHDDLEGVGEGSDLIPPELTGLTWAQVESTILSKMSSFKLCYQSDDGPPQSGKMIVGFEIGADGSIASATPESSSITDPAVEACILDRFERITFPPPNEGFTKGSFPFTLQ